MRVGLSQRVDVFAEREERRDALDQRWSLMLEALGHITIPLSNAIQNPSAYLAALQLDAVILTGGNDIADLPGAENAAPERDKLERAAIDYCAERLKALLAVCRGFQMLNLHLGGRLDRVSGHVAKDHDLLPKPVAGIVRVNSFHEWAIPAAGLAPSLCVVATAADGTIEAARHSSLPWLGVMWHPERPNPTPELQHKLVSDVLAQRVEVQT